MISRFSTYRSIGALVALSLIDSEPRYSNADRERDRAERDAQPPSDPAVETRQMRRHRERLARKGRKP